MMMDCQQAFALLQDILDKEVSQIDEKQVRAHLAKCSHCFEKFRLEESIQEFLNEKIKITANSDLKSDKLESMRSNLMAQLDDIDAKCENIKKSPFGSTFKIFLSTVAMVILVGIWYISSAFFNHQKDFIPLEQAHWATSEDISQYTQNFDNTEYLETIEKNLHYNLNRSIADYSFVGGKNENISGTDFEHIVYSNDKEYLSVFISNGNKFEIPKELKSSMVKVGDIEMYDHNCRGCRLVYQKIGSLVIITASTSKDIDLTKITPGRYTI